MPEVPEHLVPRDGLTYWHISFVGIDVLADGTTGCARFEARDEEGQTFGAFRLAVEPNGGSVDSMVARAHRRMSDILRQWLYEIDGHRQHFEALAARAHPVDSEPGNSPSS